MSNNEMNENEKKKVVVKKPSWIRRKYLRLKEAAGNFWVMGKSGFYFGGTAGAVLGSLLGLYESYRMKSFIPLPLAMISGAITFGSIFAISSVIRSENDEEVEFSVMYIDQNCQIKEKIIFIEKEKFFNNKI
jgi:hypothetical protein